jgi:hypothetical protein
VKSAVIVSVIVGSLRLVDGLFWSTKLTHQA